MSIATRPWAAACSASASGHSSAPPYSGQVLAPPPSPRWPLAAGQLRPRRRPQSTAAETVIGHSAEGRPIRALRVGSPARAGEAAGGGLGPRQRAGGQGGGRAPAPAAPAARHRALADRGRQPRRRRRRHAATTRTAWTSTATSPTAGARRTASTSRGRGPASEPETQVLQRFIERERPRVTLWYHQALDDGGQEHRRPRARAALLARAAACRAGGCPPTTARRPRGRTRPSPATAPSWSSCPAGALPGAGVRRHAGAVLALARAVAPPRVVAKPIPFGAERKADMRAYARRHYGIDDHRLRDPKVIVQHYTVTDSFPPVYNTFAPNRPDPELGELPGRLRALRDRPRRDDLPARAHRAHVPPHGRASTTRRSASSTWARATPR